MIERYESPEISEIWTDHSKFQKFFKVEMALLEACEEAELVPSGNCVLIKEKATINTKRIEEIEQETRHDVIAFCSSITEQVPEGVGRFFHFGCTSSDIIDTALSLQLRASLELIIAQVKKHETTLNDKAIEYKDLLCMGRSHGMNAEPMSFGRKFASFYEEMKRRRIDLEYYLENELTAQFSGAVGNYTILTKEIEAAAAKKLDLHVEPVSTQVIPRDRIAKLLNLNALLASCLERMAFEFRHLHHSDIGEVHEGFSKGQKGSSTMPHKKNPIAGENISGLVRVIRSHVMVGLENTALWHERDISHSSAERMVLPDNLGLIYYTLKRSESMIKNLVVNSDVIKAKVMDQYQYLSSYILHQTLLRTKVSREKIYPEIQKASFEATGRESFFESLMKSSLIPDELVQELKVLDEKKLAEIYS